MPTNHSYFIAITLPEPLHSQVELIKRNIYEKYGTRSVLKSPAHITIVPPFFWGNEAELLEVIHSFSFPSFEIELKNYNCFSPSVVYIDVVENENLKQLHQQFNSIFFHRYPQLNKRHPYSFHPHVTVGNRDWKKENFTACWNEYGGKNFAGNFKFEKLSLLKNVNSLWINL